jgi:hypothetical protein
VGDRDPTLCRIARSQNNNAGSIGKTDDPCLMTIDQPFIKQNRLYPIFLKQVQNKILKQVYLIKICCPALCVTAGDQTLQANISANLKQNWKIF